MCDRFLFGLWQLWSVDDYFFLNLSISVCIHIQLQTHFATQLRTKYKTHIITSAAWLLSFFLFILCVFRNAQLNHFSRLNIHLTIAICLWFALFCHNSLRIYIYIEKRHTDKHDCLFTNSNASCLCRTHRSSVHEQVRQLVVTYSTICTSWSSYIVLYGWHIRSRLIPRRYVDILCLFDVDKHERDKKMIQCFHCISLISWV